MCLSGTSAGNTQELRKSVTQNYENILGAIVIIAVKDDGPLILNLSPEEVHKWRQPLLEGREGCLCAQCSVRTGTPSAGYPSSSRSQGNGQQWCGFQT